MDNIKAAREQKKSLNHADHSPIENTVYELWQ